MEWNQFTPQSASYRGNRSVCGLERVLPADWLSEHDFGGDEVEVYALGHAVVLLASRAPRQPFALDFADRLTAGWVRVDWWRVDPAPSLPEFRSPARPRR